MIELHIPYPTAGKSRWLAQYGLNAYYSGKHWSVRKADAQDWHMLTKAAIAKSGYRGGVIDGPVEITFLWDDGLDIDNHAVMGKMIVDGLKGTVIRDDNRKHLKAVHHKFYDGGDKIIVRITASEEA